MHDNAANKNAHANEQKNIAHFHARSSASTSHDAP
jgi:hypothetical protein